VQGTGWAQRKGPGSRVVAGGLTVPVSRGWRQPRGLLELPALGVVLDPLLGRLSRRGTPLALDLLLTPFGAGMALQGNACLQ